MSDKFCVDCKYSQISAVHKYVCWSSKLPKDLVTGEPTFGVCSSLRASPYTLIACSPDANWFEPKETAKEEGESK